MNLAYVAGLIDGEGWVSLGKTKGYYQARVTVGMTLPAKPLLLQLRERFGGSVNLSREATDRWAEAWAWNIYGPEADALLSGIRPYLRIKHRQADLVMEVERLRRELPRRPNGSAEWNDGVRSRCSQIKADLHGLNQKGPRSAPTAEAPRGKPIATWNPARCVWETNQTALCGHSEVFSQTWPSSGMTRRGTAYALPTSAPLTAGSVSSSSPGLFPTPTVSDTNGPGVHGSGGPDLRTAVSLLPTPTVTDMGSHKTVEEWDDWTAAMRQRHGNGHGPSLAIEALRLLPTPTAVDSHASGGSAPSDVMLTDAVVRTSLGARTNPRFDAGKAS